MDSWPMKMFCHKELLWVFAILVTAACTTNLPNQTPVEAPVEHTAYYGPENQYYYFTAAQAQRIKGNLDSAVLLLRKAIALDPESLYLQRELATVYIQNKEDEKALEVLEGLLQKNPNDLKSLIIYGGVKQVRKETKEAIAAYEKILTLDPANQRIYSLLGGLYMDAGELDNAKDIFNREVANFPGSYVAHFFLGKIHAQQGNGQAAEGEFKKALELMPDRQEPLFELINLYQTQGQTEKVIALYENILEKDPANIRASMELAYYYYQKGKKKDAEDMLLKLGLRSQNEFEVIVVVIQLYIDQKKYDDALIVINGMLKGLPESPDLNHLAGVAHYGLKNYDRAIAHFEKVTPESRFFQDAVVHVAFIYQEQKQNVAAVQFLKSAIEKDPDNPDFKYYLGTFYEELEDYENAALLINQAIEIEPDNPRYYFRLGVVYDKWNKKEASMEAMRTVISLDPKHANALNYLGYTYADLGLNLDEAERLIKEALKYKPDDGYITDSLGWVYYKKGEFDKALKYLKKAIELVPDDPIMLEHIGDAYLKLDDKPNALKFYLKSLKVKDKDTEALKEKIRQLKDKT
jgi:tetratricopeptide (TPR) repeat protein